MILYLRTPVKPKPPLLTDISTMQYYLGMLVTMGTGGKGVIVSLKPDSNDMNNLTGVCARYYTRPTSRAAVTCARNTRARTLACK